MRRTVALRHQRRTATLLAHNNNNNGNNSNTSTGDNNNHQNRHQLPAVKSSGGSSTESNLAVVLIGIVIMHIACHTLRVFLAGMAVHLIEDTVYCVREEGGFVPPLWSMCAESVSSLLIMVNFSGERTFTFTVSIYFIHCVLPENLEIAPFSILNWLVEYGYVLFGSSQVAVFELLSIFRWNLL